MELKAELCKPYTEKERQDFIIYYIRQSGYIYQETKNSIQAWAFTPKEMEEQAKEKVQNLECTKRVFLLILQEFGVTYSQIKELVSTDEQAQMEWDLCEKLQRKNPLLDKFASKIGMDKRLLDWIFMKANGYDIPLPTPVTE